MKNVVGVRAVCNNFMFHYLMSIFSYKLHILIKNSKRRMSMKYICEVCGYIYDEEVGDPDNGIAPGTPWENVPEDYLCPLCMVGKEFFQPVG